MITGGDGVNGNLLRRVQRESVTLDLVSTDIAYLCEYVVLSTQGSQRDNEKEWKEQSQLLHDKASSRVNKSSESVPSYGKKGIFVSFWRN
jgi:hypothetical protein